MDDYNKLLKKNQINIIVLNELVNFSYVKKSLLKEEKTLKNDELR